MPNTLYGLFWWLSGKESAWQCRKYRFDLWVEKILWRRKQQPAPVFLPGKSHWQRSLVGYSPKRHRRVGYHLVTISSVQSLSRVWLLVTSWCAARQASLSISSSRSWLRLTSIESAMPPSPYRLLQKIKQSSRCCPVGPCWLSTLNIVLCAC